ncbi:MAG TPA: SDR family NAD(P)-dependent oxidoreductase [Actinotalea caeni]|uniref:SDR family NAD(P)-dependent oxidoreductase n=1 Tax=Actinotalea caeni TaxID=1348467 RepID=UPI002B4B5EC2|nr:SDR family NAD(P)-dependent oxidoreductase [Actinotalea caeni]HLV56163.1 SDR family NAD(P)-dependent oxidoreductase [Actinotalea caeni]
MPLTEHSQHLRQLQEPVGTGFTAYSTAQEVMQGIDLTGVNAIVTGGHSGLGLAVTRALSAAGAWVTVAARDPRRAKRALVGVRRVEIEQLDLLVPESVEAFAARYRREGRPVDLLVNHAGIPATGGLDHDRRGYETRFAANHLGHFQLTLGLLPVLLASGRARVVTTTSGAHRHSGILWDDPHFRTDRHDPALAYAQSKTANVLFARELDRLWGDAGVRAFAPHPGIVADTRFNRSAGDDVRRALGIVDGTGAAIIDPPSGRKTIDQGAATILVAATSPLLEHRGGVYLADGDVATLDPGTGTTHPQAGVAPHAVDPEAARRLWELSARLITRSPRDLFSLAV